MSSRQRSTADYLSAFGPSIKRVTSDLGITMRSLAASGGLARNTPHGLDRGVDPRLTTVITILGTIGTAMRVLREELGFSVERVADSAGLAPVAVKAIEAGQLLDLLALQRLSGFYQALAQRARAMRKAA
mgnify:CR=1 FL=1